MQRGGRSKPTHLSIFFNAHRNKMICFKWKFVKSISEMGNSNVYQIFPGKSKHCCWHFEFGRWIVWYQCLLNMPFGMDYQHISYNDKLRLKLLFKWRLCYENLLSNLHQFILGSFWILSYFLDDKFICLMC